MAKVLGKSESHDGMRDKLQTALVAKHGPAVQADGYQYGASDYKGGTDVRDVFPDKVVHTVNGKRGKLFASKYSTDDKGAVKLGEPSEVEQAYKPLSEAARAMVYESTHIEEAGTAFTPAKNTLKVTVIKPGFNTSKTRFYPQSTLAKYGKIFEGAKMFVNHATEKEQKERPEGSVHDWVATLGKITQESDGRLTSNASVHSPTFRETLKNLQEAGTLGEMGVSIRAAGSQVPAMVEGHKTLLVESFIAARSVDFVTFPGAGGKAELLESSVMNCDELAAMMQEGDTNDVDVMTLTMFESRRPDLVAQITEALQEKFKMDKTVEQLTAELQESQQKAKDAETKLQEAQAATGKATASAFLTTKLAEAKLPEPAEKRIRAQFAEAVKVDGIAEAITAEVEYIKSLGIVAKPGVRGMGEAHSGTVTESATEKAVKRAEYISAMKRTGLTQEMAEASADSIGA